VQCSAEPQIARERYQSSLASSLQDKRRSHTDLGDRVHRLHTNLRLGERAVAEFASEEHRTALSRYLLKEYAGEMVHEMFLYVAEEHMVKAEASATGRLSPEARLKVIGQLPKDVSEPALRVHKAALGASVAEFLSVLEGSAGPLCDIVLRKPDRKKDRQILFGHRQSLLEQLAAETDPALVLHLAVLILFHHQHGSMLQASGKFVPAITEHLSGPGGLTEEQAAVLARQQRLVVAGLGKEAGPEVATELEESTPAVKALVAGLRRAGGE
jgi:hypothetical protein